jgi:hypothetical protein
MPALVAGIHAFVQVRKAWMAAALASEASGRQRG